MSTPPIGIRSDYRERGFSVTSSQVETITITLGGGEPPTGSLFVHSTPKAANVNIDGNLKGQTPITVSGLSKGRHSIQVTKDGYSSYTDSIDVVTGTPDVSVTLTSVYGSIYATSVPYGASVYVDGVYKGLTPTTIPNVGGGSRQVKFTKSSYDDKTVYITVFNEQTASVTVVMDATNSGDDELSDIVEVIGFVDPFANVRTSDPQISDTDDDSAGEYVEMVLFGTDPLAPPTYLTPQLIPHRQYPPQDLREDGRSLWRDRHQGRLAELGGWRSGRLIHPVLLRLEGLGLLCCRRDPRQ